MLNPVSSQFIRTLEDGTEQVRVSFKVPSRPKVSNAVLSIFNGEVVLIEQDKPTEKIAAVDLEVRCA